MSPSLGHLVTVEDWEIVEGAPSPQGATWVESIRSWNFAIFSQFATEVTLLLYTRDDLLTPVFAKQLDPLGHKTGRIWHVLVKETDAPGAVYYGWRVDGPHDPGRGVYFDPTKILSDPLALQIYFPPDFSRAAAAAYGIPNDGKAVLGVLPGPERSFDWGPEPPPRKTSNAVVYELHVRGFTMGENSGVPEGHRGTFLGIVDKIPYLKELGVTVVELLPVQQFDPQEGNYWGYMTLNFFAPHGQYAATSDAIDEFRTMVRALHQAGIEVWLDVVYNHTAEGDAGGPYYSMRGIDSKSYYIVDDEGNFWNDSGCGNTTRTAHPATKAMILRSIRYWAEEMGVDGFRFDLASILARDMAGSVSQLPSIITDIGSLAMQLDVKVVAEAWDLGAYMLGSSFPGIMWRQWNGKFRDDVRAYVRGDNAMVPAMMRRLYGSNDLFPDGPDDMYRPFQSVNFVTAHDGFCLYDLVSYNHKHNEVNGHGNTDGTDENNSWNCGWEGDRALPLEVARLRFQQMKNFATILLLSNGTPMFVAGDEFANTQQGNNNPYNQDNKITWLDWARLEENREMFDFWKGMIAIRTSRKSLARSRFWRQDVTWYGVDDGPDTSDWSHSFAWRLAGGRYGENDLYCMSNMYTKPLTFTIQERDPGAWRRLVDTSLAWGQDVSTDGAGPLVRTATYTLAPRSVVVLESVGPGTTRD